MRVYLATVAADEITWATESGLIDGIVATPSVLAAALPHADPREVLSELADQTALPIFASVGSLVPTEIVRGAKALRGVAEHVIIAIPFVEDAIPALRELSAAGVRCAATLIHSVAQGVLAAKAGASLAVVPVDALEATGERAEETVAAMRLALDRAGVECDVVAAGPPNAARFGELVTAGADAVVVTTAALRAFLQHPLTDRGIDRFLGDISRRAKPRRTK